MTHGRIFGRLAYCYSKCLLENVRLLGKTTTEILDGDHDKSATGFRKFTSRTLPIALVDLIYRMLEKDREARIPSIRLVGAELERILYELETDVAIKVEARKLDSQRFVVPRSTQ